MILILKIETEFANWCYANHIFFYSYTNGCHPGYCKIVKWVHGVPTEGQKMFPIINIQETIESLYTQVFRQSNT